MITRVRMFVSQVGIERLEVQSTKYDMLLQRFIMTFNNPPRIECSRSICHFVPSSAAEKLAATLALLPTAPVII